MFFLLLVAIFLGPSTLPGIVATLVPFMDEGVPCDWLREATDRSVHQSLLGRAVSLRAEPPISLDVRVSPVSLADPGQLVVFSVVVINNTVGTVPVLISPNQLILDPNQPASGLGVVPGGAPNVGNISEGVNSYPLSRIRLLGPQQRCVHRVAIPFNQIPGGSALVAENSTVRAFYRNNVRGAVQPTGGLSVYGDQGLWIGVVESSARAVGTG
jgi:hypothetical protein